MRSIPTSGRVKPADNPDTAFFWEGTAQGQLLLQRCNTCTELRHPPDPACGACGSLDWSTHRASGRGHLYSYTVLHRPAAPGFAEPAVCVVIELEEGLRMVSNVAAEPEDLQIGEPMEVEFVHQAEGWTAPVFRCVKGTRS